MFVSTAQMRILGTVTIWCLIMIGRSIGAKSVDEIMDSLQRQMCILNLFDDHYNKALIISQSRNLDKSRAEAEAGAKCHFYTRDLNLPGSEDIAKADYTYNYIYFERKYCKTRGNCLTIEQAFADMYVTYLAYWATINFRICGLYYATVDPNNEKAKQCNELYQYMHWFTFVLFNEKLDDFVQKWSNLESSRTALTTIEKIVEKMKKLNLDFIMPTRLVTKTEPIDVSIGCGSFIHSSSAKKERAPNPSDWPYTRTKRGPPRKKVETLFPSDTEPGESIKTGIENYKTKGHGHADYRKLKKLYLSLWRKVEIELRKTPVLEIERFFYLMLTGKQLSKKDCSLHELIPEFEQSLSVWDHLSDLVNIRYLNPKEGRTVYIRESIAKQGIEDLHPLKILRSNAIEILRNIMLINAEHEIRMLKKNLLPTEFSISSSKTVIFETATRPCRFRIQKKVYSPLGFGIGVIDVSKELQECANSLL